MNRIDCWKMSRYQFAYSPFRYNGLESIDDGVWTVEENEDGFFDAYTLHPSGKRLYWCRSASAPVALDGGLRKVKYSCYGDICDERNNIARFSNERHRRIVAEAITCGEVIPDLVLAEYPDLTNTVRSLPAFSTL